MRKLLFALLACATLAATGTLAADPVAFPAAAGDLPPVEPLPPPEADPLGTGLYVRASGGYGFATDLEASESKRSFARSRIENAATVSGGVGLKLNTFFRTDITVHHRFSSTVDGAYNCPAPCGIGAAQRFRDRGDLSATTAMLNGYYDIAEFGPVVPYVGAGLGASYLTLDDYRFRSAGTRTRLGDTDSWNAAYALMAGVAFQLTETITIDAGYRFASLGDIHVPTPRGFGRRGDIELDEMHAHEVTIGLRYVFN